MGQPHGKGLALDLRHQQQAVRLIEDRDIDITRIVEFERPMFAHGDTKKAWHWAMVAIRRQAQSTRTDFYPRGHRQRGLQRGIGEPREGTGHRI